MAIPTPTTDYVERRAWLADYFGRVAAARWARLTTDAPVGRIATTVRAGREAMASTLLDWLPSRLDHYRVLDAGCGTGAIARQLAMRGASVVAVDVAPALVDLARDRTAASLRARIDFRVADMIDGTLGQFDYVVAMDSLIHYRLAAALAALAALTARTRSAIAFTFAPRTPLLAAMHAAGRLFPAGTRAPAIEPVAERELRRAIAGDRAFSAWQLASTRRISSGFYTSQGALLQSCVSPFPRQEAS